MTGETADARATVTIVIADDHAVVRTGLQMMFDAEPGFDVVAEAGDVAAAVRSVREHKPRVLVLDLNMLGESSLGALPSIREISPRTGVVVLTMQNDQAFAREALRGGALAYVLKEAADAELVNAVKSAAEGKTHLTQQLGARLAEGPARASDPPVELTEREVEVLRLIALGRRNAEIGEQLYLSVRAVESHRTHIQQKVRHSSRAELVRYAIEHGLVEV
jgi:two-component system response regulator NreC